MQNLYPSSLFKEPFNLTAHLSLGYPSRADLPILHFDLNIIDLCPDGLQFHDPSDLPPGDSSIQQLSNSPVDGQESFVSFALQIASKLGLYSYSTMMYKLLLNGLLSLLAN